MSRGLCNFLNSLFGVVPVGGLFREGGDFALKSGCFERRKGATPISCEDRGS